ncbi:MAG TPA: Mrp/NBP35 family ATP-binding protein [Candidatus Thermoplasmatota archaeon]|nr:Mrp/NBP35 family ATP-binding protein [Candidatus Thermoplasmatota archaeon]
MDAPIPIPIPMAGPGAPAQGGPVDPRAAERLKRRLRIINNMKRIRHKLIVASGKGGVGKSTVATNLAASLAAAGHKVGILDMDLTGPNVPLMLGIKAGELRETADGLVPHQVTPNLSCVSMQFLLQDPDQAVIWRGPIKMQIIGQFLGDVAWGDLDYLVIDLPPGTSDEPLSVAQNIPEADGVILVTTPQEVAVGDVRKSAQFVQKLELPVLGVIENMSGLALRGRTAPNVDVHLDTGHDKLATRSDGEGEFTLVVDVFKRGGGEAMALKLGVPFLGSVPLDPSVMHGGDEGSPFALQGTETPAGAAFKAIVAKLTAGHGR